MNARTRSEAGGVRLRATARAGDFALDLSLEVERGPVALVGPNGAGKTSTLRLLAGGLRPDSGAAVVAGQRLFDVERGEILPPERRRVGYLPQHSALFPHMSVAENVAFGADGGAAQGVLRRFGLERLAARRPAGLSGGERQRVALARALATDPRLLLLDEPTASLDVGARAQARELLAQVFRDLDGCAIIVTHDVRDLIAWRPTIVLLEAGRVAAVGSLEQLKQSPHPFLRELLAPFGDVSPAWERPRRPKAETPGEGQASAAGRRKGPGGGPPSEIET